MERKVFLNLAAWASSARTKPCPENQKQGLCDKIARLEFLSHSFDQETARDIGLAYLQREPGNPDPNQLTDMLLENSPICRSSDADSIRCFFQQKTWQDFEMGRITIVHGWLLALTEARQCALFALVNA